MTRFPCVVFFLLLASASAFAQGTSYSFDNFDTSNGVRVRVEPTKPASAIRPRRPTKSSASVRLATQAGPALTPVIDGSRSMIRTTSLSYNPIVSTATGASSSLGGYTTGNGQIDGYLIDSSTKHGVDPLLLYSIMHQESSFKSHAVSPKGARGLMQLMPFTALRYGVTNIFDPKQNIEGGARYLRFLLDHFDGDVNLALAGYNAGEGAVEKYGWRVPPYSETQEYVRRISQRYSLLRDPNAALYAPWLTTSQVAKLLAKQSVPLTVYERTVFSVRLPDGRLQLMSQ